MSYCLSPVILVSLLLLHVHQFRRLCSPLPTPHSACKSFPPRVTWLVPPFHWGLSRSLAHGAKAFPDCFLWSDFFVFYIHPPWFGFLQSSLSDMVHFIIYLFVSLKFISLAREWNLCERTFVCFFPVVFFFLCVSSTGTVTGTLWILKE